MRDGQSPLAALVTCVLNHPVSFVVVSACRYQALFYFPILLIARISWLSQSFLFVFDTMPGADLWATKGASEERQVRTAADTHNQPGCLDDRTTQADR